MHVSQTEIVFSLMDILVYSDDTRYILFCNTRFHLINVHGFLNLFICLLIYLFPWRYCFNFWKSITSVFLSVKVTPLLY